jgi:hypothetical protein
VAVELEVWEGASEKTEEVEEEADEERDGAYGWLRVEVVPKTGHVSRFMMEGRVYCCST